MEFLDSRRLPGASLLWRLPGSVVDVSCSVGEREPLIQEWEGQVRMMLGAVGWHEEQTRVHHFANGVSLAISAPIDALYVATELNEWAFRTANDKLSGSSEAMSFPDALDHFKSAIAEEENPRLLLLRDAALAKGVPFLSDDDEVSLGYGVDSQTWPVAETPEVQRVDWEQFRSIPVGLITGTNGKTTSVRLAVRIARAHGKTVGMSSTDWVGVNDRVIDRGDYSGPGGARAVLRDKEVNLVLLETARGGLLRRGLGVERADAALITNIAEDHLGDFGSQSINELLDVKWVVSSVLDDKGTLVLNADDGRLVEKSKQADVPLAWFSVDPKNTVLQEHVANDGLAATVKDDQFFLCHHGKWQSICAVADVPLTLHGIAKHNISNVLGAALLTYCLGISLDSIAIGLKATQLKDNPGRCNLFTMGTGTTVLVDFAHNTEGMQALFDVATQLPAKRKLLCFAQAGDRTNDSIKEMAGVAWRMGLEKVHISELAKYARGRERREVFGLLREGLMAEGAQDEQIVHFEEEVHALQAAVDWAQPGDLIIMLALGSGHEILGWLNDRTNSTNAG